jgi:hypothetical protein
MSSKEYQKNYYINITKPKRKEARKNRVKKKEEKPCVVCGKMFLPKIREGICSIECMKEKRKKYNQEYHTKAPKIRIICNICGIVFLGRKKQKYCSSRCRKKAFKKYIHEYGKKRYKEKKRLDKK